MILLDSSPIMMHQESIKRGSRAGFGPGRLGGKAAALVAAAMMLAAGTGCTRSSEEIPPAEVRPVEAYRLTLDESASPEQVVYVLLRALADDVAAAQAHEHDRQREAMKTAHALAAYATIEKRLIDVLNQSLATKVTSLGDERDAKLFEFTKNWAPIVSHYVQSFETDAEAAIGHMEVQPFASGERTRIYYPVCHDPTQTDPARRQEATLDIELVKTKAGPRSYWRVARVAFRGRDVTPRVQPVTQPAVGTQPADGAMGN